MDPILTIAAAVGVFALFVIAWTEARIRVQIAEEEARANRRQVVLSRSFRRGGAK